MYSHRSIMARTSYQYFLMMMSALSLTNILFCIFIVLIIYTCTCSSPKHLSAGNQPVQDIVNTFKFGSNQPEIKYSGYLSQLKRTLSPLHHTRIIFVFVLIFGVLMPLLAIFQLYHSDRFQCWKKPEYPERTTDHGQATGKLYHLRLRVECTLFVIYKARREPMP